MKNYKEAVDYFATCVKVELGCIGGTVEDILLQKAIAITLISSIYDISYGRVHLDLLEELKDYIV